MKRNREFFKGGSNRTFFIIMLPLLPYYIMVPYRADERMDSCLLTFDPNFYVVFGLISWS